MQFGCCYVGRLRCELAGVIDVVVSCCYPNLIWVFLLWEMVDNDPRIRYRAVLRGVMYVLGEHDKHCICTLLTCFGVALIHTTKVLAKCCHSGLDNDGIFHQAAVACYGFNHDEVDHWHGVVIVVDGRGRRGMQLEQGVFSEIICDVVQKEEVNGGLVDQLVVAQPQHGRGELAGVPLGLCGRCCGLRWGSGLQDAIALREGYYGRGLYNLRRLDDIDSIYGCYHSGCVGTS